MEYKYGKNENYEDFASGRVLYHNGGVPNFPVRLAMEIYGRCTKYLKKETDISLYDCCCGGGYLLTVLGLLNHGSISRIIGSDIDPGSIEIAKRNLGLLSADGISKRMIEIQELIDQYGKQSHIDAKTSGIKLKKMLRNNEMSIEVFVADALRDLQVSTAPDIIITDVPYGNLVNWDEKQLNGVDLLLASLYNICDDHTVIGICMDKKQKISGDGFSRLEKQIIGKRKFEILRKHSG
jgi:SAM-dependent methyltransferase